jgi:hypothetical protein
MPDYLFLFFAYKYKGFISAIFTVIPAKPELFSLVFWFRPKENIPWHPWI